MTVKIEQPDSCSDRIVVRLTRGDRLALVLRIDGASSDAAAERLAAWTGADWLAHVRDDAASDDSPLAEFEVTEEITGDVGMWTFAIDDTDALEAAGQYPFDLQINSGPLAPYTYLSGSTIIVEQDVSREVGS